MKFEVVDSGESFDSRLPDRAKHKRAIPVEGMKNSSMIIKSDKLVNQACRSCFIGSPRVSHGFIRHYDSKEFLPQGSGNFLFCIK